MPPSPDARVHNTNIQCPDLHQTPLKISDYIRAGLRPSPSTTLTSITFLVRLGSDAYWKTMEYTRKKT